MQLVSQSFSLQRARAECEAFGGLLASTRDLQERKDILPFFAKSQNLLLLMGGLSADIGVADCYATEFPIFGQYRCDAIVGKKGAQSYCVIEFESGANDGIFSKVGRKSHTEWSRSFERGFSQVVDWFYVFDDFRQNDEFRTKFGSSNVSFIGALIIGRDDHFRDESEKNRFQWRKNNILVGSKKIVCMTYDELLAFFNVQIVNFEDMVREQNATR